MNYLTRQGCGAPPEVCAPNVPRARPNGPHRLGTCPQQATGGPEVQKMLGELPPLEEDLLVRLFHKGARISWTSHSFDWDKPDGLGPREKQALARVLSPIYLGEQTAMLGAAAQLPEVVRAGQTTAQLYLASFIMDEARHFEALSRLYAHLGHHPIRIRELPDMLRYHHQLRQGDRLDWVWGILISDVFARHFYEAFARRYPGQLVGLMAQRIVVDEGRHQAFAEEYLRRALPHLDPARRRAFVSMKDELLRLIERMYQRLQEDAELLGLDRHQLLDEFVADLERRIARLGLNGDAPNSPEGPHGPEGPPAPPAPPVPPVPPGMLAPPGTSAQATPEASSGPAARSAPAAPDARNTLAALASPAAASGRWGSTPTSNLPTSAGGRPEAVAAPAGSLPSSGEPPARWRRLADGWSGCGGCLLAFLCARRLAGAPAG